MSGGCGGGNKKPAPAKSKTSTRSTVKPKARSTNWSTGFGTPRIKFSFGGSRGR
jgi:hypothetical protein